MIKQNTLAYVMTHSSLKDLEKCITTHSCTISMWSLNIIKEREEFRKERDGGGGGCGGQDHLR